VFRALVILTVFAAVTGSGTVAGLWTGRWSNTVSLDHAPSKASQLPMTLGDWDGQTKEVDPRTMEVAGCSGLLLRQYVNRRTGDSVSVMLMCGRAGPVSVHTPDVCYAGGYDQAGPTVRHTLASPTGGQFWVRRFQKKAAIPLQLRIFYSWNATGTWQAPDNPRWSFAHRPLLYKLYLIRELSRVDEPLEEDASLSLLQVLVPELKAVLFPDS
jgi:hypothetical protein